MGSTELVFISIYFRKSEANSSELLENIDLFSLVVVTNDCIDTVTVTRFESDKLQIFYLSLSLFDIYIVYLDGLMISQRQGCGIQMVIHTASVICS